MGNLVEHAMINKLDNDIGEAIETVGGDISNVKGIWDYPCVIKSQLSAAKDYDLISGSGIEIQKESDGKYIINATAEAKTVDKIYLPFSDKVIEAGTRIQDVFDEILDKVIPQTKLKKGDIIVADKDGYDFYNIDENSNKVTGLIPNNHYLRLFPESQTEPIYIDLQKLIKTSEINDGSVSIEKLDPVVKDQVSSIPEIKKQTSQIPTIKEKLDNTLTETEADNLVDEIF